jgi:hypothetical protein
MVPGTAKGFNDKKDSGFTSQDNGQSVLYIKPLFNVRVSGPLPKEIRSSLKSLKTRRDTRLQKSSNYKSI